MQRAEEHMEHEHQQVVQALEETSQSHNNALARQNEESYEAQLQERQASVNHKQSVMSSHARGQEQH
eukprot:1498013-Prorocentrum_lima.AAC.1